ncbi:hypothetical protein BDV27DRAFT_158635 [Aspergillus caelatus]|uniref:NACHT domain-containing protein n=1 Tax=Aspergillus caelatus TaxID=61420 RepID=A0A5N7A2E9_9EURO|nr:uncharacterized protein BDV27DRAFT_158635 [Aspergillus caelatus]KAE8363618.1 hypothetical protein BDV27DRAFT_158635 [Aspergillus caelatus]
MSEPAQYTVGWICALETEYAAARAFLDKRHSQPKILSPVDYNVYTLGEIGGHQVVIAAPLVPYGTSAARVARDMVISFPDIRFWLIVGIGGGAPTKEDIRLGDVVVSSSQSRHGGLLQYDMGKELQKEEFHPIGFSGQPPTILLTAVYRLQARYALEGHRIKESIQAVLKGNKSLRQKYTRPHSETDRLYESQFTHPNSQASCAECCDDSRLIFRPRRREGEDPTIHYGLIASTNMAIKDAIFRDKLAADQDVLCFETEAVGLMNHIPCLVIRGICDYTDSHKSKEWQGYAAIVAAAYAKELLSQIDCRRVYVEPKVSEVMEETQTQLDITSEDGDMIHSIDSGSAEEIDAMLQSFNFQDLPVAEGAELGIYIDQREEFIIGARTELLLKKIDEWAVLPEGKCLFWLNGDPGTGKSTIARTVAKTFQERRLLGASFFFTSGKGDRGNAALFFPTITTQLFTRIPRLRAAILQVLRDNPGISAKPLKEQFDKLLLEPLLSLERPKHQSSPLVIVIDALDECDGDNDIRAILQLLPHVQELNSIRLRFFITSRPYSSIQRGFQSIRNSYQDLNLHSAYENEDCIQSDIESIFSEASILSSQSSQGELRAIAISELASLLLNDDKLRALFPTAMLRVGPDRFQRNFTRILKKFGRNLKGEAANELQSQAAHFVQLSAQRTATEIRKMLQQDNTKLPIEQRSDAPKAARVNAWLESQKEDHTKLHFEDPPDAYTNGSSTESDSDDPEGPEQASFSSLEGVQRFLLTTHAFMYLCQEFSEWLELKKTEGDTDRNKNIKKGSPSISTDSRGTRIEMICSSWWLRLKNICSPPAAGYERIHYRCGCGELSYIDVKELSIGGIEKARQSLLASIAAVSNGRHNSPSSNYIYPPPQAHLNDRVSVTVSNRNSALNNAANGQPLQSTVIGNIQAEGTMSQNQEAQFLLMCVNTKNSTMLVHIEVGSLTSDQYLFQQMHQEYQRVRKEHEFRIANTLPSWVCNLLRTISIKIPTLLSLPQRFNFPLILSSVLSKLHLHKVSSGDFVRFQLVPIGMETCPRWFKTRTIPPEAEVKAKRYIYKPVPMEDVEFVDIPLQHLLKPGPHTDTFWLNRFPKKIREPLIRLPGDDGQRIIGWGIRINECLNWSMILFSIFLILLAIGVSVVLYATITADNSSAFAFGAFMVAMITVYLTYQYFAWKEVE